MDGWLRAARVRSPVCACVEGGQPDEPRRLGAAGDASTSKQRLVQPQRWHDTHARSGLDAAPDTTFTNGSWYNHCAYVARAGGG
eukprot:351353-Chlamydomonas_euryale.AAC.2